MPVGKGYDHIDQVDGMRTNTIVTHHPSQLAIYSASVTDKEIISCRRLYQPIALLSTELLDLAMVCFIVIGKKVRTTNSPGE